MGPTLGSVSCYAFYDPQDLQTLPAILSDVMKQWSCPWLSAVCLCETERDTQRHAETRRDTQRHAEARRDTQRHMHRSPEAPRTIPATSKFECPSPASCNQRPLGS